MTEDKINEIWDRADFAAAQQQRAMDDLLREMENSPPAVRDKFEARFIELNKRILDRAMDIRNKAHAGDVAPHLKIVD